MVMKLDFSGPGALSRGSDDGTVLPRALGIWTEEFVKEHLISSSWGWYLTIRYHWRRL